VESPADEPTAGTTASASAGPAGAGDSSEMVQQQVQPAAAQPAELAASGELTHAAQGGAQVRNV
jgi:hypothetical protein